MGVQGWVAQGLGENRLLPGPYLTGFLQLQQRPLSGSPNTSSIDLHEQKTTKLVLQN